MPKIHSVLPFFCLIFDRTTLLSRRIDWFSVHSLRISFPKKLEGIWWPSREVEVLETDWKDNEQNLCVRWWNVRRKIAILTFALPKNLQNYLFPILYGHNWDAFWYCQRKSLGQIFNTLDVRVIKIKDTHSKKNELPIVTNKVFENIPKAGWAVLAADQKCPRSSFYRHPTIRHLNGRRVDTEKTWIKHSLQLFWQ